MNTAILSAYLAAIIAIGILARRGIKNITDFAVAGRNYGTWVIFATLSASYIGAGFSIGNAERVFTYGIANIICLFGFSLQIILISLFIAPRMDKYRDAITAGDIIGKHYGKAAKVLTGLLSVVICAGLIGAQVGAMGYIFNVFTGIPRLWGILLGCSIIILYSTIGGMKAVVTSDILQFSVLSVGIPLTLLLGVFYAGGVQNIISNVPASRFSLLSADLPLISFISLFLTFLMGEMLVPPYVQRLLMSPDAGKTARGTFYSGIFSMPFFVIAGLIGLVALSLEPSLNPNLAMPYIVKTALPIGISGLVIAAIISIIMSSADSFLNAASVAIVNDIVIPLKKNKQSDRAQLKLARLTNLAVGSFAVVFALKIESILEILIYSYNFWAPVIPVPLVSALIGVKVRPGNFFAGLIGGLTFYWVSAVYMSDIAMLDNLIFGVMGNIVFFYGYYFIQAGRVAGES